jgi:hypothetical protein
MGYDDVRSLLRHARVGDSVTAWRTEALSESRLLAGDRRTTQLRIATAILRPVDGFIVDRLFIEDLAAADESTVRDLIYARYLASVEIAVIFADRHFRVSAGESTPDSIARGAVRSTLFTLLPTCSEQTRERTRNAINAQFGAAGVVRVDRAGNLQPTRRRPAAAAVFHLICDDLRDRREASDTWLFARSLAAALFAIRPNDFAHILEDLIASGRLRRSYYAGEPRVLAA